MVFNALSDLRRREADIAICHIRPTAPDLIARLIRTDHAHLYAAPPISAATLEDGVLPRGPDNVVTGFNLLHLLPDPAHGLRAIAKLVRPGGFFISKTPCLAGRYSLLKPVIGAMRLAGNAPKVHFLSPARLQQAVTQAGFEIIETGDFPKSPPSHFIVARRV